MCGIAGFLHSDRGHDRASLLARVERITSTLHHRGPDAGGTWADPDAQIALGHRRLSIIDLSEAGAQPMTSANGRYTIVYNGEVYNFRALRAELEAGGAGGFRGYSDTEVILEAVTQWGPDKALEKFNGMFAFALWDGAERSLLLARDRLGEKPLYYGVVDSTLVFASELKALRAWPGFDPPISRGALELFLRHGYVPSPHSIFEGVHKLRPGHAVTFRAGDFETPPQPYWSIRGVAASAADNVYAGSPEDAVEELEALLLDSVKLRMESDVPLGAFLSGGIDSSTVVSLMQAQSSQPVRTFSIGFHEAEYNEATHAARIARHLGTDHTELYVTPREAMSVVPELPGIYDEPFADSSQIPTVLVARLARTGVTVSLSGDGGDELFCGYHRYANAERLWRSIKVLPGPLRRAGAGLLNAVPGRAWDAGLFWTRGMLKKMGGSGRPGEAVKRVSELLGAAGHEDLYLNLLSNWTRPEGVVIGGEPLPTAMNTPSLWPAGKSLRQKLQGVDVLHYLPDDILTKVDRATMSVSLEGRIPLLDPRVVEFAWRLPESYKVRGGVAKWVLRKVLERHVPAAGFDRPKMGFGVPIDHWLRGDLQPWAHELISEERLRSEGYFNPEPIRAAWNEHVSGTRSRHYELWNVLMFQSWLAHWRGD